MSRDPRTPNITIVSARTCAIGMLAAATLVAGWFAGCSDRSSSDAAAPPMASEGPKMAGAKKMDENRYHNEIPTSESAPQRDQSERSKLPISAPTTASAFAANMPNPTGGEDLALEGEPEEVGEEEESESDRPNEPLRGWDKKAQDDDLAKSPGDAGLDGFVIAARIAKPAPQPAAPTPVVLGKLEKKKGKRMEAQKAEQARQAVRKLKEITLNDHEPEPDVVDGLSTSDKPLNDPWKQPNTPHEELAATVSQDMEKAAPQKGQGRYAQHGERDDRTGERGRYQYEDGRSRDMDGDQAQATAQMPEESEQSRVKPDSFLNRTCYFENTYLGGNAAYEEQLRRLDASLTDIGQPHRLATARGQSFDPPGKAGLGLHATLSRRWFDEPQRVFLQVALTGSERYGWRRPPIEMVVVIDPAALRTGPGGAVTLIARALSELGPQDRLAVVLAGPKPTVLANLTRPRQLRTSLVAALRELLRPQIAGPAQLAEAVNEAGRILLDASTDRTTVPGTQTVLLLAGNSTNGTARATAASGSAHGLTVQGVVTSVIELTDAHEGSSGNWWVVANAGHGNYHHALAGSDSGNSMADALDSELESLAQVVGRLLRLNIRLASGVQAVRVLGSRILDTETVKAVKAREVATDRRLSKAMGITADRGDDDDGIQTVIPYFYGGDTHVVVIELWVERPGEIADITLRYKDLVNVDNATARTSVNLRNVPRPATAEQVALVQNLSDFRLAEHLTEAANALDRGQFSQALQSLGAAAPQTSTDRALVRQFTNALTSSSNTFPSHDQLASALRIAGQRKIGGARH